MIKKQTILSTFNKKYTLMEWLKRVEKALKDSVLVDVTVITLNATQLQLSFNFEDGTHIITPIIALPKGDKGDKGDTGAQGIQGEQGVSVVDVSINVNNHLIVTLSNGTEIDAGVIQGGGTITVDGTISSTSENPVQNKVIYNALLLKQNALTTSSVVDGTIDKQIGFNTLGEIVKQVPINEIFFATYGSTTYNEIRSAINNGKLCICIHNGKIYISGGISSTTQAHFFRIYTSGTTEVYIQRITCETPNRWGNKDVELQRAISNNSVSAGSIVNILGLNSSGVLCKQALSGGTQLYRHEVLVGDNAIIIINNISSRCSSPLTLISAVSDAIKIQIELDASTHAHNTFDCLLAQYHGAISLFGIDDTSTIVDLCTISSTTITINSIDYTECTDTVTTL